MARQIKDGSIRKHNYPCFMDGELRSSGHTGMFCLGCFSAVMEARCRLAKAHTVALYVSHKTILPQQKDVMNFFLLK